MRCTKLPQQRLLLIWLTQEESKDESIQEIGLLPRNDAAGKAAGWKAVIFRSGDQDLFENTLDLLLTNRS